VPGRAGVPGHQSRILSARLNTVPKTENTEYGNLSGWTISSDDQGVGLRAAVDLHDRPSLRGRPRKIPRKEPYRQNQANDDEDKDASQARRR